MSNWKYVNGEHKVVYRINKDGSCESHLVESIIIQDYLSKDGQIDLED